MKNKLNIVKNDVELHHIHKAKKKTPYSTPAFENQSD